MIIDLRNIPEEGLELLGSYEHDIFNLEQSENLTPADNVSYKLHAQKTGSELLLTGTLDAHFNLTCVRCNQDYLFMIGIEDFTASEPLENGPILDLTDTIREDILLALPDYPHCDDADVSRPCPATGKFEKQTAPIQSEDGDSDDRREEWDALDDLKTND